jgi:DNA-binding transcriptional ArsR family regulator
MATTVGLPAETVFALHLLARNPNHTPLFTAWRRQVTGLLGTRAKWIAPLARSFRSHQHMLDVLDRPSGTDIATLAGCGLDHERFTRLVQNLTDIAIIPYWQRMLRRLEAERDVRGRMMVNGGVEVLLSMLHSRVRWTSYALEVADAPAEIHLNGQGLLLAPSFFLCDTVITLGRTNQGDGQLVLAYPIVADRSEARTLWEAPAAGNEALAALVGRTRAEVLLALADTCTTGKLAERLGISSAGASQHATVLRAAGLVMSHRDRNTVRHTLTSLGAALLTGTSPREIEPTGARTAAGTVR